MPWGSTAHARSIAQLHALFCLSELQRGSVNAITQAGWFGAVVEDVAEVRAAACAFDLGADLAEASVNFLNYILSIHRLPKAGPARS